ncbi:MAG: glycerol-3-phosphate acyltransferase [Candidatus Kapabacteria bacterium]|nr:glycerol-3-phosphate acyltransferase [Candidatus Kapabacteria bacterium]
MLITNIVCSLIAFALGAIPSAYIIVKYFSGKDIRKLGTGNVGAMNSYEVTNKKWIGLVVFLMDFIKGLLAVFIARYLGGNNLQTVLLAAIFAVLGHNYNPFLKFKGGRGLAVACGVLIPINLLIIIFWVLMWLTGYYAIKRDVHVGNIVASIGAAILLFRAPEKIIHIFATMNIYDISTFRNASIFLCFLILLRHSDVILEIFKKNKNMD